MLGRMQAAFEGRLQTALVKAPQQIPGALQQCEGSYPRPFPVASAALWDKYEGVGGEKGAQHLQRWHADRISENA